MKVAKIFKNGRSQAVRLPKEYQFDGRDVYVHKINNIVVLFSKNDPWSSFIESLDEFSNDFMDDRKQPALPNRKGI